MGPSDYPIGWSLLDGLLDGLQDDFNHSNPPEKMPKKLDTWKFETIIELPSWKLFLASFLGFNIPKVKQEKYSLVNIVQQFSTKIG